MPIKVSIVEDDARVREGLSFLLEGSAGFACASLFSNAEAALKQLPQQWPDVVLMDINLPKMSGIECVLKLKALNPSLQIVMLTSSEDEDTIFNSLKSGASGYLVKQTPPTEILEAIEDVHKGGSPMSRSIARKVVRHFQQEQPRNETESLSKRELEILTYLTKGLQYKEIADTLDISIGTVRTHLRSIYEKLHVRSRTEAVVKFLGNRGAQ
jgi:DNA-binding NarL/FixJ family response regulator